MLKILSYELLASEFGIPKGTLYTLVHQKRIPHIRLGDRFVRFDRDEIVRWLKENKVPVQREAK